MWLKGSLKKKKTTIVFSFFSRFTFSLFFFFLQRLISSYFYYIDFLLSESHKRTWKCNSLTEKKKRFHFLLYCVFCFLLDCCVSDLQRTKKEKWFVLTTNSAESSAGEAKKMFASPLRQVQRRLMTQLPASRSAIKLQQHSVFRFPS